MGLSGSRTTTTSGPSAQALPYLNTASSALQNTYNSTAGTNAQIGSSLADAFRQFNQSRQNNPNTDAANDYIGRVLGGEFLNGNPQLQNVIDTTNESVADRVNALFSKAGQTGSSRQIGELGKQLSANESGLRYQSYNDEQDRIGAAIAQALAMRNADATDLQILTGLGSSAAQIPWLGANNLAAGLGGLWGNSQTTTQKQSGNVLGSLLGLGGSVLGGWASGGFK